MISGNRAWMTWLLVLLGWAVCAVVVAPCVGRFVAHGSVVRELSGRPVRQQPLPTPRSPVVLH